MPGGGGLGYWPGERTNENMARFICGHLCQPTFVVPSFSELRCRAHNVRRPVVKVAKTCCGEKMLPGKRGNAKSRDCRFGA